jgi:hypothetical protein
MHYYLFVIGASRNLDLFSPHRLFITVQKTAQQLPDAGNTCGAAGFEHHLESVQASLIFVCMHVENHLESV